VPSIHEKVILYKQYLKDKIRLLASLLQVFQNQYEMLLKEDIDKVLLMIEQENDIMQKIDVLDQQNSIYYQETYSSIKEIGDLEIQIQSIGQDLTALHHDIVNLSENTLKRFDNQIKMVQKERVEIFQRQNVQGKYLNPYEQASQTAYFIDKKK